MTRKAFFLVDDVKIKIEQLLKPCDNSLSSQCREILELVYKQLESFEKISKTILLTDLDVAIWSEVYKLRGIVAQVGSIQFSEEEEDDESDADNEEEDESDEDDDEEEDGKDDDEEDEDAEYGVQFSIDEVENLKQRIHSFTPRLKLEEQSCVDGLYNSFPDDEEEEEEDDDEENHGAVTSKMIGMCDVYEELKDKLMSYQVTSIVGMPGIGKTTLANKVFHDPTIVECFDHRVWLRLGKKWGVNDIPRRILAEIDPDSLQMLPEGDVEAIHEYLKEILKIKSYLIVLDDVWDRYITHLWHPFYRFEFHELNHPFLHSESESRILLTSRLQQLCRDPTGLTSFDCIVTMRLLNKEESWDLLRDNVFCKGSLCPPELEKAGKKISENCEGLPLMILTVARLLLEEESTLEYWNDVATRKNHELFLDAYDEISKVLLPSYTYLPRLLQMCFLFIGLFPQNYEIPRSKLINLWLADRFLELNINISSDVDAINYLEELVTNSLIIVYKHSTFNASHTIKTCGLHSSLWHLSKLKARETMFALVLSNLDDCLGDDMEGHHRLAIHTNVLFGIKDVQTSVEDNCASAARSLLCFGPYHQYQVPLFFRLNLLRELDALSIRFYEFPMEVLQLVRLTYLSLTSNGIIPASISQLKFLKFFIVDRHQRIKSCKDASYLPVEIWSLSELEHLQVMGSDLPDPHGASLDSLSTLLNVSARSCTEVVLKGVPNLMELRILIELAPDDDGELLSCFAHISHLSQLYKLKCVIVNPVVAPPIVPFTSFPGEYLENLCLSGLGYPWKEMGKIGALPFLKVLKLKNFAFQGPEWEVEETEFAQLISLVIEDTDIVSWKFGCGAFKDLMSLKIKHCYKLQKIHGEFGEYLIRVELVDCNPPHVAEMRKAITENATLRVLDVHSSWDDKKRKK